MPLAFHPDETNPLVAALLSDLGIAPGTLDLAIDARDEMLGFLAGDVFEGDRDRALFDYFRSGASIAGSLGQVLRWRWRTRDRLEEERARAADATAEAAALRLRVQGMEASRFWKIRNAWFAVKRGLGLTEER
jgi:hypothetical protein